MTVTRGRPHQISVTGATYDRMRAVAKARGLRIGDVIDAAIAGAWPTENPRVAELMAKPYVRPASLDKLDRFAIEVSAEIHELVGDHVVRHGGEVCQVFEAAVARAIEASEKGWRFEV